MKILIYVIILLDKKSRKNILVYDVLDKILIDARLFRIMSDKVDRFARDYDGTKNLELSGLEKFNAMCEKISIL